MRERLPDRRACLTFKFRHLGGNGSEHRFHATTALYGDGRPGEIFLASSQKDGTDLDLAARDVGILISIALQHGASLAELRAAVGRDSREGPVSVAGSALDALAGEMARVAEGGEGSR